jgi:salicylate hydroxylase
MVVAMSTNDEDHGRDGIHLLVIGAGLAGLSTAVATKLANPQHRVTICEAVKALQEVGVSDKTLNHTPKRQ